MPGAGVDTPSPGAEYRLLMRRVLAYLRAQHAGLLALMIALGGTSYAAVNLPRDSVGARELKRDAVGAQEIKRNAVTTSEVQNRSLLAQDFKPGELPRGATGERGATGSTGARGARGPTGPTGVSDYEVVLLGGLVQPTDTSGSFTVTCPDGKKVLGGGVATFNENIQVMTSTPIDTGASWVVNVEPDDGATFGGSGASSVNVRVVCAFVEPEP